MCKLLLALCEMAYVTWGRLPTGGGVIALASQGRDRASGSFFPSPRSGRNGGPRTG
jgi:hypothetical protein